jgi:hypothetical protein
MERLKRVSLKKYWLNFSRAKLVEENCQKLPITMNIKTDQAIQQQCVKNVTIKVP